MIQLELIAVRPVLTRACSKHGWQYLGSLTAVSAGAAIRFYMHDQP